MHYRNKYGIKAPFLRKIGGVDASISKAAPTPTQRNQSVRLVVQKGGESLPTLLDLLNHLLDLLIAVLVESLLGRFDLAQEP